MSVFIWRHFVRGPTFPVRSKTAPTWPAIGIFDFKQNSHKLSHILKLPIQNMIFSDINST